MSDQSTSDPHSPTALTCFATEVEAAIIISVLAENGIQATTAGSDTTAWGRKEPADVTVVKRHCDLQRALEVLAEVEAARKDIDWSAVDVGEPEA